MIMDQEGLSEGASVKDGGGMIEMWTWRSLELNGVLGPRKSHSFGSRERGKRDRYGKAHSGLFL
jgi:hypothetical protein